MSKVPVSPGGTAVNAALRQAQDLFDRRAWHQVGPVAVAAEALNQQAFKFVMSNP